MFVKLFKGTLIFDSDASSGAALGIKITNDLSHVKADYSLKSVLGDTILRKEAIGGRLMKELIKKRNMFMSTTLMCGLLTAAFSFDSIGIHWFWSGNIPVAIVLGSLTISLGTFWFRTQRKFKELINQ